MEKFTFINKGKIITTYKWEAKNPVGVIQIIHGMAEHAKRYEHFAKFLNEHSYTVYADDHRGHGETLETHEQHGEIGEDGFNLMIEDEYVLTQLIKKENPGLAVIVMGHSMGSFILQEYLLRYGDQINKAILSGSCGKMGPELGAGRVLAYILMKTSSKVKASKLLDKLSFGTFNSKFKEKRTDQDWLSRDERQVDRYIADEYCGNIFPAQFYYYFYGTLLNLHLPKRAQKIPKNLPLFILSGDMDPVGQYGKGVKKLHKFYVDNGLENTQIKLYPGGRHEMLNEINKDEVYRDALNFIK